MTKRQNNSGNSAINVSKIHSKTDLNHAHKIRYEVFVIGQNVPEEEEIDEYEDDSVHFLAIKDGVPCGAARWRVTSEGVKLERFAVLDRFRGMGVGSALVEAVLYDIENNPEMNEKKHYLNAQLPAMSLYRKFGFQEVGEVFQECDIDHYKMER